MSILATEHLMELIIKADKIKESTRSIDNNCAEECR